MRIAVIAPPWTPIPPVLYGGIELVVDRLATGFKRAGHEVLLCATGDSTCRVPRHWLLAHAEGQRMGYSVPELRHVLDAYDAVKDYDIVHDHTMIGPIYGAAARPNQPVVSTIHGPLVEELRDIYVRMAAAGTALVGISRAQVEASPDVPVARVIHHGLDAADFPIGAGEGGYFLFLGRMSPDKGPHRAMDAAYKAGVPLIMCAKMREPWEFEYFDTYVRPYLNEQIQYYGEVPHQHKLELLSGARGLLFPIRWNEPFGMVMIEALACGTPVLAFPEGAAPEVVIDGKTGFLCDDVAEMTEAIGRVDEIDRADCRAAVEGYFSTDRMVAEHIALFEELLAR